MYDDDLHDVKTIDDCIETATIDCQDEDEALSGWFYCLSDILDPIKEVMFAGETVVFEGVEMSDNTIMAAIIVNNKKVKISFSSIELIKPSEVQSLWIKAWLKYSDDYS